MLKRRLDLRGARFAKVRFAKTGFAKTGSAKTRAHDWFRPNFSV
jgi:hypothetical protein